MEKLDAANKRLKTAHDDIERDYEAEIAKLTSKEGGLLKHLADLDKRKLETAEANGNVDASDNDVIEINAGGKVITAKRSTLTQLNGTRLEALFSGRWDKKLQKDGNGRIFLDVSPVGFQAIVDYLNELKISSEDTPPEPPSVDEEHQHLLRHQLEFFGLRETKIPVSNILKTSNQVDDLHGMLEKDGLDGDFCLIYRGSKHDISGASFHSACNSNGSTLTVIETTNGYVFGGYSNTPWTSSGGYHPANKAFLFVLSGNGILSSCKMKLKNSSDGHAVYHGPNESFGRRQSDLHGPVFGCGHDLSVHGSNANVSLRFGNTYHSGPTQLDNNGRPKVLPIKEMEVFQVTGISSLTTVATTRKTQTHHKVSQFKPAKMFAEGVNRAINAKQESLAELESEILHLEESLEDEAKFVTSFACGDAKDVVTLNVSGTIMVTKRSTLCIATNSVLAQQFDDSKWTEQGCNNLRVKEWSSDDVSSWVCKIDGIPDEVANTFTENEITGRELLALKKDGLMMLGINRTGTLCLLLEEIEMLKKASQDVVTLIEHSPYCFGKILDYLRLKQIHSQGLVGEPALPKVCDSQKSRFDKVVKYFFPGASAKFIFGD